MLAYVWYHALSCTLILVVLLCLAYIREGSSDLRIYVAVTSPYPWNRGVTDILVRVEIKGDNNFWDDLFWPFFSKCCTTMFWVTEASVIDLNQDQKTSLSLLESPEDISKESHPSDSLAAPRIFARTFSPERGYSSFEISHFVLGKTTSTINSIDSLLYLWSPLRRQLIPCFTHSPRLLHQCKQLQKAADIAPTIKGRISSVTEESQRAGHMVIESRMTRTVKKNSWGI